jgi:hypothetical protein
MKKALKIICSFLIVLWFGGNLGLYVYVKYFLTYENKELGVQYVSRQDMRRALSYTPEKLILHKNDLDADTLRIFNYRLKFPYYKKDIINILLSFFQKDKQGLEQFAINLTGNKVKVINFNEVSLQHDLDSSHPMSFLDRFIGHYTGDVSDKSRIYYSTLSDYNWWNLPRNLKLTALLLTKAALLPVTKKIYDVETPFIKGYLTQLTLKGINASTYNFDFSVDNKNYVLTFFHVQSKKEILDVIASIQPVDDIEQSYNKAAASYEKKDSSNYPEEILLVSMISIKSSNTHDLKALLNVLEDKMYHDITIEDVRKELEYLEGKS